MQHLTYILIKRPEPTHIYTHAYNYYAKLTDIFKIQQRII